MNDALESIYNFCDRIDSQYEVKIRKAYNVYVIYTNDKPIFYIRDGIVYVKIKDGLEDIISLEEIGYPFAKTTPFYILPECMDEVLNEVIARLCEVVKDNFSKNSISRYSG